MLSLDPLILKVRSFVYLIILVNLFLPKKPQCVTCVIGFQYCEYQKPIMHVTHCCFLVCFLKSTGQYINIQ